MKDLQRQLTKLRDDAAECAMMSRQAPDNAKRDLFAWLSYKGLTPRSDFGQNVPI
jgi:hypothetical protein